MSDELGDAGGPRRAEVPMDPSLMQLYEIVFSKLNQEGDAIWRRFNIITALNLAALAALGYVLKETPVSLDASLKLSYGICFIGVTFSVWSFALISRNWKWHEHWRAELETIEAHFPVTDGWVRPFLDAKPKMQSPRTKTTWLRSTQVVAVICGVVWLVLWGGIIYAY